MTTDCLFRAASDRLDAGDFDMALELSREGLLGAEDHAGLLRVYGLATYHLDEPLDALEGLEGASLLAPLDPVAQVALADVYVRLRKPKSARAILKFLVEPGRCPVRVLPDVARVLGRLGAYRAALKVCRRIVRARAWYHPAHFGAAFYSAKLGMPAAKIIRHLWAAHESAPDVPRYRVALAGTLANAGRYEEACELIRPVPPRVIACRACLMRLQGAAEVAGDVALAATLRDRPCSLRDANCRGEADRDCFGE